MTDEQKKSQDKLARYVEECRLLEADIELLKQGLARVTVAANGVNPTLDKKLDALRKHLRAGGVSTELKGAIDELTNQLRTLDEEKRQDPSIAVYAHVLTLLVDFFDYCGESKRYQKLKKMIDSNQNNESIASLFTNLLSDAVRHVLSSASTNSTETPSPHSAKVPSNITSHDADKPQSQQVLSAQSASSSALPSIVVEQLSKLLAGLIIPPALVDQAASLKKQLQSPLSSTSVEPIVSQLVSIVSESFILEQENFKVFLEKVTDKFNEMSGFLSTSLVKQDNSLTNSTQLRTAIDEKIGSIRSSLQQPQSLTALTSQVDNQLTKISAALKEHREEELKHIKKNTWQVNQLKLQLSKMKAESDVLKSSLSIQEKKSQLDSLTGIANRESYDEYIVHALKRFELGADKLVLAIADIDNFKQINDNLGHLAGDAVLAELATLLSKGIRSSDFMARYGGEEFVFVFEHTPLDEVVKFLDKLRLKVQDSTIKYKHKVIPVTLSFGVSEFKQLETVEAVFARADKALYGAKAKGKNCVLHC